MLVVACVLWVLLLQPHHCVLLLVSEELLLGVLSLKLLLVEQLLEHVVLSLLVRVATPALSMPVLVLSELLRKLLELLHLQKLLLYVRVEVLRR